MNFHDDRAVRLETARKKASGWVLSLGKRSNINVFVDYGSCPMKKTDRDGRTMTLGVAAVWVSFTDVGAHERVHMFGVPTRSGWKLVIPKCPVEHSPDWFFATSFDEALQKFESVLDFWFASTEDR